MLGKSVATGGETDLFGRGLGDLERRVAELERSRVPAFLAPVLAAWTTWTPDYTFGGAARTPTSVSGRWVRIGTVAIVNFTMLAQSTESGSVVRVTNLPIAAAAGQIDNLARGHVQVFSEMCTGLVRSGSSVDLVTDALNNPALTAGQVIAGQLIFEVAP